MWMRTIPRLGVTSRKTSATDFKSAEVEHDEKA